MTQGLLRGIEDGWFMSEIAEAAFPYQVALEKGEKKVVGVNCHTDSVTRELEILRVSHEVEAEQVRGSPSAGRRATRPRSRPPSRRWSRSRAPTTNMIPSMLEACRAEATPGRDLRRAARRVGRVPRARPLLKSEPQARWGASPLGLRT